MPQHTAHSHDLPLVMKRMRQEMMQHQRRSPRRDIPIRKMEVRICDELSIGQARQISMRLQPHVLLQRPRVGDRRTLLRLT